MAESGCVLALALISSASFAQENCFKVRIKAETLTSTACMQRG